MNNNFPHLFDLLCPHFSVCSGCSIDKNVNNPSVLKDASEWFKGRGIEDFALKVDKIKAWRMRAKLAVRGTRQDPQIGLYEQGSHKIVPIPFCQVHHGAINLGVRLVKEMIKQAGLEPYDEKTGGGDLRYLQFIVEGSTGKLHVSFVLNLAPTDQFKIKAWRLALSELWEKRDNWHSFSINFNQRKDNVIFGSTWELWEGEAFLWEKILNTEVCFKPSSFAQANTKAFENMLKTVDQWVLPNQKIAEYYAGVGVIGLTLAPKSARVLCCEINDQAKECFDQSFLKLNPTDAKKIKWFSGPSTQFSHWLAESDVIIVDPPRKGLEVEFLNALNQHQGNSELIYISCGWKSFKKDATVLLKSGWELKKAEGFLFFPGSDHIETIALFSKNAGN